jgi:hypothetical protein
MKFNKWTLGLAAVGVVSLASAVKAEETANTVLTSLSSTTISGYVDTSIQWNLGTGNANVPAYKFGGNYNTIGGTPIDSPKADGFNLNVVQLSIAKPLDESEWAAGYRADLWLGPDANVLQTSSQGGLFGSLGIGDFAIRQAYIALRTPIGNGIDWKVGVFDSIIGYESIASPNDPNYTRSWGHSIEPQTHTGLLGSYRINDSISLAAGIANTQGPTINGRGNPPKAESYKTYMGSIAFTAPDSFGPLAGSTLYGGVVNGFSSSYGAAQTSWYAGTTLATPITGLRFGMSFDALQAWGLSGETWSIAGYGSYQATEKLSLHARIEYLRDRGNQEFFTPGAGASTRVVSLTGTAQYDLWKNVLTRLEFRWDHSADGTDAFGGTTLGAADRINAVLLAANVIYKF